MPTEISREDVLRMIEEGAQLVEVLPFKEYEEEHLPGAIHLPLKELDQKAETQLDKQQPVIVYCNDLQWDMSPRAASRLESLGFTQVFDYAAGKMDWLASGLPSEGTLADVPRAGNVARRDVPTCRLTERIGEVRDRIQAAGWEICIVVNAEGVVLGRLRRKELESDPAAPVEEVMESGPTTIRPHVLLESIIPRMHERKVGTIVVTTADGRLVGVLHRADGDQRLAQK